jgi:sugar O-acyltransferase (sialic acid O-acetyltransferase NeuD family)
MKEKIILIGGGGHCKSCIDVIEQEGKYKISGIVDLPEKLHGKIFGYEIIATDEDLPLIAKEYSNFLVTIGQIRSANKRILLFNRLRELGVRFPVIVSPLSHVSKYASVSEGTIIMHHALVNAGADIGKNCIINSKALIEHDVVIEGHCHIATGGIVNGGAKIKTGTFFGSNAVSREYIDIGKESVIGCAAHVVKNVPSGSMVK